MSLKLIFKFVILAFKTALLESMRVYDALNGENKHTDFWFSYKARMFRGVVNEMLEFRSFNISSDFLYVITI